MPADNKRFCEIGGWSDNPDGVQLHPQLRKAAGPLSESEAEVQSANRVKNER